MFNSVWSCSWPWLCHIGMVGIQLLPRSSQLDTHPWVWWSKDAPIWPSTASEDAEIQESIVRYCRVACIAPPEKTEHNNAMQKPPNRASTPMTAPSTFWASAQAPKQSFVWFRAISTGSLMRLGHEISWDWVSRVSWEFSSHKGHSPENLNLAKTHETRLRPNSSDSVGFWHGFPLLQYDWDTPPSWYS